MSKWKALLKEASEFLCAASEDVEFGDYCRACGSYVGEREKHRKDCLYVRIHKALKKGG
jgi:HEPN domain-containing protein